MAVEDQDEQISEIESLLNDQPKVIRSRDLSDDTPPPSNAHPVVWLAVIVFIIGLSIVLTSNALAIGVCKGSNRAANKVTCIYDGDTGWQEGQKWRMLNVDTPEINSNASCGRENSLGHQSRDRLIQLMNEGYEIRYYGKKDRSGRLLVDVFVNSQNVADILKSEGLAQDWPNRGNIWCN